MSMRPLAMNAREVLDRYWSRNTPVRVPVDPIQIAKKAGLRVSASSAICVSSTAPACSGQISLEEGKGAILYDPTAHHVRQRFTVAHELGHYFLGHLTDGETFFRDGPRQFSTSAMLFQPKETAANRFAAELLVPMDTLNDFIVNQRITEGYDLAIRFEVSTMVIDIRVKEWQKIRSQALV